MKNLQWLVFGFMIGLLISSKIAFSQSCNSLNIQHQADINGTCSQMHITIIHDMLNRPFIYEANKEAGLSIYDVSNLNAPSFVNGVSPVIFGNLHVMNLYQDSIYVYLALGNHFTSPQQAGMAIIDMTSPFFPVLMDFFIVPGSTNGAGVVKVEGNYAYLGAMKSGLVIFDVSDKSDIQMVSQFIPDINYPVNNPNPDLYNARGMEVKDDIIYLCYDAGGIRIINCADKLNPVETGRYVNPVMYQPFNLPRAYNNVVLNDTLLYVTVDYCGLEILNVSDTSNISLTGWWNPYNCPGNNWFASPSHTNEIAYDPDCNVVFISTGKSDMMVVDVSNPQAPDSCNFYGGVNNGIGTWGISRYENEIYLSYICTPGIPFASNWTGFKILTYAPCATGVENDFESDSQFSVFPNPANESIAIRGNFPFGDDGGIYLINAFGQQVRVERIAERNDGEILLNVASLPAGIYAVVFHTGSKQTARKFIVSGR